MGKKDALIDDIVSELETWSLSELEDLWDQIAPEDIESEEEDSD